MKSSFFRRPGACPGRRAGAKLRDFFFLAGEP